MQIIEHATDCNPNVGCSCEARRETEIVQWFECPECEGHGSMVKRVDGKPTARLCPDCQGEGRRGATEAHLESMDPGSNNPFCRHDWSYSGTQYGGDDERWGGEGRVICSYCGADGDA